MSPQEFKATASVLLLQAGWLRCGGFWAVPDWLPRKPDRRIWWAFEEAWAWYEQEGKPAPQSQEPPA